MQTAHITALSRQLTAWLCTPDLRCKQARTLHLDSVMSCRALAWHCCLRSCTRRLFPQLHALTAQWKQHARFRSSTLHTWLLRGVKRIDLRRGPHAVRSVLLQRSPVASTGCSMCVHTMFVWCAGFCALHYLALNVRGVVFCRERSRDLAAQGLWRPAAPTVASAAAAAHTAACAAAAA